MAGKNPAFQFYPSDWSRDLEEHPLEIEGAWIRICCKLWWSETRGKLERTSEQWAKILRVYPQDAERILNYIKLYRIGEVFPTSNGNLTVISRRMLRDEKDRENNCIRQKRFYNKQKPNALQTPTSQDSSVLLPSSSTTKHKKTLCVYPDAFQSFWKAYPKHVSKKTAFKEWEKATSKPSIEIILSAIENQKRAKKALIDAGQFASEWPDPERWIKKERWNDEIEASAAQSQGKQISPYKTCDRCGQEYLETDAIEIKGRMCCPKCPEAREESGRLAKVGYGKVMEEITQRQGVGG